MWVLMVAAGAGCLVAMKRIHGKARPWVARCAAACFAGAGLLSVGGWIGRLIAAGMHAFVQVSDRAGHLMFGTALASVLVLAIGLAWLAAMVPNKWFKLQFGPLLVFAGLWLPGAMAAAPGPLGRFLAAVIGLAGRAATAVVDWGV